MEQAPLGDVSAAWAAPVGRRPIQQLRIGVLASGPGAGLQAIVDDGLPVVAVVVDRPCGATSVASRRGIPSEVVRRPPRLTPEGREAFTRDVVNALARHRVELVVMAGFMTILEQPMFDAYPSRVLNVHPSLLPRHRGAHAVADVLAAGEGLTGCTIHIATLDVDHGPILAQEVVPVLPDDTENDLTRRIQAVEHRLYPATIRAFMAGDQHCGS